MKNKQIYYANIKLDLKSYDFVGVWKENSNQLYNNVLVVVCCLLNKTSFVIWPLITIHKEKLLNENWL